MPGASLNRLVALGNGQSNMCSLSLCRNPCDALACRFPAQHAEDGLLTLAAFCSGCPLRCCSSAGPQSTT